MQEERGERIEAYLNYKEKDGWGLSRGKGSDGGAEQLRGLMVIEELSPHHPIGEQGWQLRMETRALDENKPTPKEAEKSRQEEKLNIGVEEA